MGISVSGRESSCGRVSLLQICLAVQVGMDARSLAARLPSRGPAGSEGGRKGQTDQGAKNAQQRRLRAFRQALVRAVEPSHQAFLLELRQQHSQQHVQQQPLISQQQLQQHMQQQPLVEQQHQHVQQQPLVEQQQPQQQQQTLPSTSEYKRWSGMSVLQPWNALVLNA